MTCYEINTIFMFKVLVSFAFISYVWAKNDNCRCGYKYIPKDVYQYNRPRRWLEERPPNNTNVFEDSYVNDAFTNFTVRSKHLNDKFRRIGDVQFAMKTGINEFPMMAAIYKGDSKESDNLFAGGTIISSRSMGLQCLKWYNSHQDLSLFVPRYILTAAHVLLQMQVNETFVIVGEHHREKDLSPDMQKIKAAKFIIHKEFRKDITDYDIAVIELEKDIKFSDRVGPVCLPFNFFGQDFAGSFGTYLGWGSQFASGPVSKELRKVDVQVLSQDKCRKYRAEMTERQMCTFTPGRDSCEYDSGGPFLYTDPVTRRLFIIGIISFGRFCATNNPGFATRVTTLLDWIQQVAPADYCKQPPRLQDSDTNNIYMADSGPSLATIVDAIDYTILAPASVVTIDTVVATGSAINGLIERNRPAMVIFGKPAGINSNTPAIRAAKYMIHPGYRKDRRGGMYDIGVIKLEKNINACLNQRTTQRTNPSYSQVQGSDWGLPLPTLSTPWHTNPDQCFNVSVLNNHQLCERTSSEINCNNFVRSILEDHVACPIRQPIPATFMGPPFQPQGIGPNNRPHIGSLMGQPMGLRMGPPLGPRHFVPQPPHLCKTDILLPPSRGHVNQNFVNNGRPTPPTRPMVCCLNQRRCEIYKGPNVPIPYSCKLQLM